jgi:hypothetical protein
LVARSCDLKIIQIAEICDRRYVQFNTVRNHKFVRSQVRAIERGVSIAGSCDFGHRQRQWAAFQGLQGSNDTQKQQQTQGGRECCSCLGCQGFRGFTENKKGCSSGTAMELAKMTVSSSVGPLLHLFLCLVSECSSTSQGGALEAILLPLQGEERSLERAVELDQTVATCDGL